MISDKFRGLCDPPPRYPHADHLQSFHKRSSAGWTSRPICRAHFRTKGSVSDFVKSLGTSWGKHSQRYPAKPLTEYHRSRKRSPPQQNFDQSNAYQTPSAPPSATAAHTPQNYPYQNTNANARSPPQSAYDPSPYPPPTPVSHASQYGNFHSPNPYEEEPRAKRSRYSGSISSNLAVQPVNPPGQGAPWPGPDFNYAFTSSTPTATPNHHGMRSNMSSQATSAAQMAAAAMGSSGVGGFASGGRLPVQGAIQGQSPEQPISSLPRPTDFNFGHPHQHNDAHPQMMFNFGQHELNNNGAGGGGAGGMGGGRRE